jgi:hypothetical protein
LRHFPRRMYLRHFYDNVHINYSWRCKNKKSCTYIQQNVSSLCRAFANDKTVAQWNKKIESRSLVICAKVLFAELLAFSIHQFYFFLFFHHIARHHHHLLLLLLLLLSSTGLFCQLRSLFFLISVTNQMSFLMIINRCHAFLFCATYSFTYIFCTVE